MGAFCPQCGKPVGPKDQFCSNCGAPLESAPAQGERTVPPGPDPQAGPQPGSQPGPQPWQAGPSGSQGQPFGQPFGQPGGGAAGPGPMGIVPGIDPDASLLDKIKADFTTQGRLNRKRFWIRSLIGGGVSLVADSLVASRSDALSVIGIALYVALCIYNLLVEIRRCHDLDKSGWYLLWLLVPLVNIYVGIRILFVSGTAGPNRFGDDPLQRDGLW